MERDNKNQEKLKQWRLKEKYKESNKEFKKKNQD
jgi:hypothetical protein